MQTGLERKRFLDARKAEEKAAFKKPPKETLEVLPIDAMPSILDRVDTSLTYDPAEYKKDLARLQVRLRELEFACFKHRLPVVVGYEGWDAAGKGGNIKRLTQTLDPRGYNVVPIAAPKGDEAVHHYLWRFWRHIPKAGHITIFDRTWYGRTLVERVEGFTAKSDWQRGFQEINEFEQSLVNWGAVVVKFWIHISNEEQLRRFEERQGLEYKQYKITDEDWRNREKWDAYKVALTETFERTSTSYAPWTIVEGNDKYYARIKALKTIIEAIEGRLGAKK
jgi:polyphosphate kinase 2 (PPK2 family)